MYGSSLHAEVFCSDQPSSVKLSLSRFATSFVRSSFARCTVVPLGLQMDSPSQRQPRLANADAPTDGVQAFLHGSSSEVRKGLETPSDLAFEKERPMRLASSAQSMERRGVVAPSDGLIPVSVTMPRSNVRSDGLIPDASQKLKESLDVLPCVSVTSSDKT